MENGEGVKMSTSSPSPQNPPVFSFLKPDLFEVMEEVRHINKDLKCNKIPNENIKVFAENYLETRELYKDSDGNWITARGSPIKNWRKNLFQYMKTEKIYSDTGENNNNGQEHRHRAKKEISIEQHLDSAIKFSEYLKNYG